MWPITYRPPAAVADPAGRGFVPGLVLCTLVPLVMVPLLVAGSTATPLTVGVLLAFAYAGHIPVTGWLGAVPGVRRVIRDRPGRMVVLPLTLVAVAMACAGTGGSALEVLLLVFFTWQFTHFSRQNLGLAARICASCAERSPTQTERRAVTVAGLFATAAILLRPALLGDPFPALAPHVAQPALWVTLIGWAGATLCAGVATVRAGRSWPTTLAIVGAAGFFAPAFFAHAPVVALSGMAMAHGLQYLWIVRSRVVEAAAPRSGGAGAALRSTVAIAATALVGGTLLSGLSEAPHISPGDGRLLFGAYFGIVMAHFAVDAMVWRRAPTPERHRAPAEALVPSAAV